MTTVQPLPLKYLFTAAFADGTTYVQTADDKSIFEPDTRSCYTDLERLMKTKTLVSFVLKQVKEDGSQGDEYGVDLRDGHFETNGVAFRMHEEEGLEFELIYFRKNTVSFLQKIYGNEQPKEISHTMVYRFGWKVKGNQPYQRVMQID